MPDASGAPTTKFSIPKYNTANDAPSGKGNGSQMDAIDALLANLGIAGLTANDVPVYDSVAGKFKKASGTPSSATFLRGDGAWVNVVKTTVSTMAGGPPGSPVDGDIWIATAVDANGTRWAFQYNAGSGSAYKWEFIGGAPAQVQNGASSTASTTYVDLATPVAFTLARGGDYQLSFGAHMYNSGSTGSVFIAPSKGGAAASDGDSAGIENHPIIDAISVAKQSTAVGMSAASIVKLQARVVSGTAGISQAYLFVVPIRVS